MKTRKGIGLVLVIALLVLANACLDYTAVCKGRSTSTACSTEL